MATEYKNMQARGGTEAEILGKDEVPLERELVVSVDTSKVRVADGITPLSELPYLPPVDPTTNQLPFDVRDRIAANLSDPTTPEGAALAEAIAAAGGGGGGSAPLTYDALTGIYSVPAGSTITHDAATGAYSSN